MEQQKARYVNPFTDFGFKKIFGELNAAEIAAFTQEEAMQYEDSLKVYRDIKNSLDTAREEGRQEGREEGKALGIIEMLRDGDISFAKARQKIDQLKSQNPDATFWPGIYESLNRHDPASVKEPAAKYRAKRKTSPRK